MKFTLSWLKEHLKTDAALDQITETLTDLGLEVESVENPGEALGAFTICRVIDAARHPNADRLRLCRVEVWPNGPDHASEEVQVVCGASNARAGLVGVFAAPGTHVPGIGVHLKPGVIRGVESNGMLCSERELTISDNHDGIIDLPKDAPLGARFIDYAGLDDPVIEIAVTPNRPDALGVAGIARDLAARGLGETNVKPTEPIEGGYPCPVSVTIEPDVLEKGCPLFAGRLIRGVKNGPSPDWLQRRLRAIGLRPISALVDVTNLVTFDRNRPLHVFDAAKIKGSRLRVHWAESGSKIVALDEREYTFQDGMMAISDGEAPESIAGIMGGLATGCTEGTKDVFLESAFWDPVTIAATGRRLKINSDARYRFERGVDPAFTPEAVDLATGMILDLCGGDPSEMVIAGSVPDTSRAYALNTDRVAGLVGMEIPHAEQMRILAALGFSVGGVGGTLDVRVPSWRPDIRGEADLVEEIIRVASLAKLEAKPLPRDAKGVTKATPTPIQRRERGARRQLANRGLNECVTYSFVSCAEAELFAGGDPLLKLENPISAEMSDMRPSLLPGLLAVVARNQVRGLMDMGLFEIGSVFEGPEPGEQALHATAVRTGAGGPRHWSGSVSGIDLYAAKADAETLLASIGVAAGKPTITRDAPNWFHPGRSGALKLGPKNTLAVFGELHPKILGAFDVKGPASAMTVFLENVPFTRAKTKTRTALERSDFQSVERDFAFIVDAGVEAGSLLSAVRSVDKKVIKAASVFDVFAGSKAEKQFGEGKKSIAVSLRLQPFGGTLTDAEIAALSAGVVAAVEEVSGGRLRS